MTNLTFAQLTALIAVNGLTPAERYYITDNNWTIIAITTNTYRTVVPIVTELTFAELEILVAANGLNEGLQYKVTDKGWLLTATGANTYLFTANIPYKSILGLLNQSGTSAPTIDVLQNDLSVPITINYADVGDYNILIPYTEKKLFYFLYNGNAANNIYMAYQNDGETFNIQCYLSDNVTKANNRLQNVPFEIRIYES